MAAIAAAQQGVNVALLEPGAHVGGMVSGGLSNSDVDRQQHLIGGLARTFFSMAGAYYRQPIVWAFEPHIAEDILRRMLYSEPVGNTPKPVTGGANRFGTHT